MKTTLPALSSRSSKYGAQMGRTDIFPDGFDRLTASPKLRLVRLDWVDGDYDQGGAYWGNSGGTAIYRAIAALPCAPAYWFGNIEMFIRAAGRLDAKAKVCKMVPGARFYT